MPPPDWDKIIASFDPSWSDEYSTLRKEIKATEAQLAAAQTNPLETEATLIRELEETRKALLDIKTVQTGLQNVEYDPKPMIDFLKFGRTFFEGVESQLLREMRLQWGWIVKQVKRELEVEAAERHEAAIKEEKERMHAEHDEEIDRLRAEHKQALANEMKRLQAEYKQAVAVEKQRLETEIWSELQSELQQTVTAEKPEQD